MIKSIRVIIYFKSRERGFPENLNLTNFQVNKVVQADLELYWHFCSFIYTLYQETSFHVSGKDGKEI